MRRIAPNGDISEGTAGCVLPNPIDLKYSWVKKGKKLTHTLNGLERIIKEERVRIAYAVMNTSYAYFEYDFDFVETERVDPEGVLADLTPDMFKKGFDWNTIYPETSLTG